MNEISSSSALVIVDQQRDFEPGGALPVSGGDEIVPAISSVIDRFGYVVVTQDSHPEGHISFASSYKNKKPFDLLTMDEVRAGTVSTSFSKEILLSYLAKVPEQKQVLWPDHCVAGTEGWALNPLIRPDRANLILRKGTRMDCDSYSIFYENDGTPTGLSGYFRERGIQKIVLTGLAGDYCVFWSARDARRLGFEVYFSEALTRFIDHPSGSKAKVLEEMNQMGVHFLPSNFSS